MGGLSGKAFHIKKIQAASSVPLLVVDSGNLIFKPQGNKLKTEPEMFTAETIVKSYKKMAYDAVAVSIEDLAAGEEFFEFSKEISFPWLSANVFDRTGELLFAPYIVRQVGNIRVGIIGITGSGGSTDGSFTIGDWKNSLSSQLQILVPKTDLIILLSNLPFAENSVAGKTFAEIDLIISADKRRGNLQAVGAGNAIITQSISRGKYLGRISLQYHPAGKWNVNIDKSQKYLRNQIQDLNWQINQLQKRSSQGNQKIDIATKLNKLTAQKNSLAAKLKSESERFDQLNTNPALRNNFRTDFIAIKPGANQSTEVNLLVSGLKDKINIYNRKSLLQKKTDYKKENIKKTYVGYSTCKQCHIEQSEFWQSTGHSQAYTTLVAKKEQLNPECLVCHVTSPLGLSSYTVDKTNLLALPYELQTIGCEVCHGPAAKHSVAPKKHPLTKRPPASICSRCHTPDRDNDFDYREKLEEISCPKS